MAKQKPYADIVKLLEKAHSQQQQQAGDGKCNKTLYIIYVWHRRSLTDESATTLVYAVAMMLKLDDAWRTVWRHWHWLHVRQVQTHHNDTYVYVSVWMVQLVTHGGVYVTASTQHASAASRQLLLAIPRLTA